MLSHCIRRAFVIVRYHRESKHLARFSFYVANITSYPGHIATFGVDVALCQGTMTHASNGSCSANNGQRIVVFIEGFAFRRRDQHIYHKLWRNGIEPRHATTIKLVEAIDIYPFSFKVIFNGIVSIFCWSMAGSFPSNLFQYRFCEEIMWNCVEFNVQYWI